MHIRSSLRRWLPCALALVACDTTEPSHPGSLAVSTGDTQVGAAGEAVPIAPAVRVLDESGRPLGDVPVRFAVVAGAGSVANAQSRTDAGGIASSGRWTLGTQPGPNTLSATVDGLPAVTFSALAVPGMPASIVPLEGDGQVAGVGERLPVIPVVQVFDAHGNLTPAVPVRFATTDGSGTIGAGIAATDDMGIARSGSWTLDTISGTQTLRVFVDGGPSIEMTATARPARAIAFEITAPRQQVGSVGAPADAPPAVVTRDRYGNGVDGLAVRFVVVAGDGTLHPTTDGAGATDTLVVTTDDAGAAAVGRWTFGTRIGPQAVRAAIVDDTVMTLFTAEALAGPPASFTIVRGQDQSAQAGTIVAVRPTVAVRDAFENPVAGLAVTFTTPDDGIVNLPGRTTAGDGTAAPLSWILGLQPGPQTLIASVQGLPDVTFQATATTGEPFNFDYFYINVPEDLQAELRAAGARWEAALIAGQPDATGTIGPGFCGPVAQEGPFDDLRIILLIDSIDGPGQILGSAGPCAIRSNSRMPVVGGILLDSADIPALRANARLADVLVHEIGHILGIGTRWAGVLVGASGDDPHFIGEAARAAFDAAGGHAYAGLSVPVENTGGPGTRNGHWRETVFRDELMTGFLNVAGNPLSAITIGSLQDIGYFVDPAAAEPWFFLGDIGAQDARRAGRFPLIERAWPREPIVVDEVKGR